MVVLHESRARLAGCTVLALLLLLVGSCAGEDAATPRRKAYPRVAETAGEYVRAAEAPISMEVNASSIVTRSDGGDDSDGSVWLDVSYPMYGAVLYCTFTPAESKERIEEILDNRRERIALNTGGNTTEIVDLTSPAGFESSVAVTPIGTVTPVQFLANDDRWVVTGAFYLPDAADAQPDSIAPIVDVARRDVIRMMKTLGAEQ